MSLSLSLGLTLAPMMRGGGGPPPPVEPLEFATPPALLNDAIQQGDTLEWTPGTTRGGDGSPITWSSQVQLFDPADEAWEDYGAPFAGTSGLALFLANPDIWGKLIQVVVTATQGDATISAATEPLVARNGYLNTFESYSTGTKIYPIWSALSNFGEQWLNVSDLSAARNSGEITSDNFPAGQKGLAHTALSGSGTRFYGYGFDVGSPDSMIALRTADLNWSAGTQGAAPRVMLRAGTGAARLAGTINVAIGGISAVDIQVYSSPTTISGSYRFHYVNNGFRNRNFRLLVEGSRLDIVTDLVFTSITVVSGTGTPTIIPSGGGYIPDLPTVGAGQYAMIVVDDVYPRGVNEFEVSNLADLLTIDNGATVIHGPGDVTLKGYYYGSIPEADAGRTALQVQQEGLQGGVKATWANAVSVDAADGQWEARFQNLEGGADYNLRIRKGNVTGTAALTAKPVPIPAPFNLGVNLQAVDWWRQNDVFSNPILRAEPRDTITWAYELDVFEPDADGFPTVLPAGHRYGLALPRYLRMGEWKIFYTPGTTLILDYGEPGWTVNSNNSATGVAVVTITADSPSMRRIDVTGLPPGGLKLLKMFKSSDIAAAGGDYNDVPPITQHWIDSHVHYKTIRMMDWMRTNRRDDSRPIRTSSNLLGENAVTTISLNGQYKPMPFHYMLAVANALNCNLWVTPSDDSDDTYVTALATALYNGMPAGRKVFLEFSNEVWNWGSAFYQTHAVTNAGLAAGEGYPTPGVPIGEQDPNKARGRQYAKRHLAMINIFKDVFGEDYADRVVAVCGAQQGAASDVGLSSFKFDYPGYLEAIDAYATAPYFGADTKTTLTGTDLDDYVFGPMTDAEAIARVNTLRSNVLWVSQKSDSRLKYVQYEGGQHYCAPGSTVGNADFNAKRELAWQIDPRMETAVYPKYIAMSRIYGGEVCHFVDVDYPWGAAASETDLTAPKYAALLAAAEE